jgi:hypothetical protein
LEKGRASEGRSKGTAAKLLLLLLLLVTEAGAKAAAEAARQETTASFIFGFGCVVSIYNSKKV